MHTMSKIQVYIVKQVSCKVFGDSNGSLRRLSLLLIWSNFLQKVSFFEQLSIELYNYRGFVCGWHVLGKPPFPALICARPSDKRGETPKNTLQQHYLANLFCWQPHHFSSAHCLQPIARPRWTPLPPNWLTAALVGSLAPITTGLHWSTILFHLIFGSVKYKGR